jgi:hypothetical protein
MPTYRGLRASQALTQDLIRRIHRDVLPRAEGILDRSDARMNRSLTREVESTQRLLDPEPPSRCSVGGDDIK